MFSFYVLLVLIIIAVVAGITEYQLHQKRIYSIPIRIHVNGTRGKSSVTRLIGAGLRAGGFRTITKVTGTYPRLILEDGSETAIIRKASANIIEQLSIVKFAAKRKADALVMECMALQPQYQTITEHKMIHSTVGVITNIRIDHTDVMGHTLQEIASTIGRTIPKNHYLFTTENHLTEFLEQKARENNSTIHFITEDSVSPEEMEGFSYIEHRANVALALKVCEQLGIQRKIALEGMYKAIPDAGVLTRHRILIFHKEIVLYNAFAANDPDSTYLVWEKIKNEFGLKGTRIILLNTRQDRLYRAEQLLEMIATKILNYTDHVMLIGQSVEAVYLTAIKKGIPAKKLVSLGWTSPEKVFDAILSLTDNISTILAIGNMGGMGGPVIDFFKNRSIKQYD